MVEGGEWCRVEDGGGWRVRCLLEEHADGVGCRVQGVWCGVWGVRFGV